MCQGPRARGIERRSEGGKKTDDLGPCRHGLGFILNALRICTKAPFHNGTFIFKPLLSLIISSLHFAQYCMIKSQSS